MAKKFRKEIGYIITTSDGAKNEVSQKIFEDNGGASGYAEDYPDATIRMRDANNRDYQVPLSKWDFATQNGLRPFRLEKSVGYDEDDISDWLVGGAEANEELGVSGEELGVRGEELKGENDLKEVKDLKAVEADEPEAAVKAEANEELGVRGEELGVRGEELGVEQGGKDLKGEEAKMDVKAMWRGDIQNPETVELADAYMESKVRPETKKAIAGAVLNAFAEEQKKGNQRALEQMSKPINGGFVPAYSGFHQAVTRSGEIAKAIDIKPMIENVTKNIVNDTAKMRAAILPYMEAGYDVEKASEMAINDIADSAQSLIIDEYQRQNAPESTLSYIAGNAFRNSLVAQLAQGLARVAGGASGLNEQLKDEAYAQAGEKAGMMARVTSGVGSLLLDAPIFSGLGQLGGAAAKGVTNAVGRQVATKVMGASGKAGVNAASRYVGGNVGMRMAQGSIGTGITLGSYDALGEALRGMRTDSFDVKEVLKRGTHGLGTGAAIGWITPASRYMSKDMSKAGKVMMDAGAFVTEAELFNLSGLMEEGKILDLDSHVEGFAESAATLGMMKGSHALPKLATKGGRESLLGEIKARYNSPDYENKARFTREELADLKAKGYDLKEVFKSEELGVRSEELKGENDLKELRDLKGVEEVTPEVIEKNTRKEWEALETYQKMQADDRVPLGVKAKMAYYVEGKMAVNMPKATRVDWNKSGDGYVVETYDAMGRLLSRKNFARKDVKEVRKLVRELELACEGNSFSMLEDVNDRIIDNNAEARAAYDMAEGSSVEAKSLLNRVREIQAKADKDITDEERRLLTAFEVKRARYSLHENSSETIKSQIENETGLKIEDILSKSASKRSLEEVAALAKYRRELMRQLGVEKGFKELGVRDEELGVKNGENAEKAVDDADETNMRPVDVEDAIKVYELDEKSSNYIRKNPSEYASVLKELEADRAMAHAYAKGEPGSEAPEYWDYWKERDGLSELGVRSEELGVEKGDKVIKDENAENAVKEEASEELGVRGEGLKGENDLKEVKDLKAVEAEDPEAEIKAEEVKRDVEDLTEAKKEDKPEVAAEKPAKVENKEDVLHIKDRVTEWSAKTGEAVRVVERVEDVVNTEARAAIESGVKVKGWYDTKSGEVVIYAPNVNSVRDVDLTVIHEVVSHKGLRDTLGKETYDRLCDKTWEMMDEDARAKYENYPGVGNIKDEAKRRRAAADEYIAGIAEKEEANMTEAERSAWKEVVKVITDFIKKIFSDAKITEEDIRQIIRASYRRMMEKQLGVEKGGKDLKEVEVNKANKVNVVRSRVIDAKKEIAKRLEKDWSDAPTEVREVINRLSEMSEPIDVEDVVYERLENLRSPKTRHKLVLSSEGGIKGVSDELGLPAKELQRMVGFNAFALPKNGGVSLQKMAESIAEDINDGTIAGISNVSESVVRDMLIEAIRSAGEPADISYHRARRRMEMAQKVYEDWKHELQAEEARYIAEEDAYNAYEEYYIEEIKEALEMLPEGGITAIFADEYIRENQIRQEYEQRRIVERGNRSGEVLQGARINTSRGVGPRTEGRTVSKGIGNDMLKGEDAVAQGGETSDIAKRETRVERELGVDKGLKGGNGENRVARVEEAIREQEIKRVADKLEGLDRRLAEIRTELSEDKEGRNIQAQADAMVELYGGYANAPADVRERIDNQVAKLSERRRALLEEERAIELEIKNTVKTFAYGEGEARFAVRKWYGGNSGYEGYSMSKRAAEAREEGRYPKTDFKKEYGVTDKELKSLIDAGIVSDKEWHHTSKYGNKTTFYGFENKGAIDFYNANKARVKGGIKDGKLEDLVTEFEDAAQSYYEAEQLAWREAQAEEAKNREAHREYADYIKNQLPATYTAKNGAVVELNGSRRSENWVASLDGVRLGKRHGKGSRDTAFAEARDFVYDSFPTFEEWKEFKGEKGGNDDDVRFSVLSAEDVKDEYKVDYAGDTLVVIDKNDLTRLKYRYSEQTYKAIEDFYNKEGVYGVSLPKRREVIIFKDKTASEELTWWHEHTHVIYEELSLENKEEAALAAMNWLRDKGGYYGQRHYEEIVEKYSQEDWASESAARLIEYIVDKYGAKRFLSENFEGNGNVLKLANAIRNKFIYGTEEPTRSDILRREQYTTGGGTLDRRGESENTSQGRFGYSNTSGRDTGSVKGEIPEVRGEAGGSVGGIDDSYEGIEEGTRFRIVEDEIC